jgi:hypothetical protein
MDISYLVFAQAYLALSVWLPFTPALQLAEWV